MRKLILPVLTLFVTLLFAITPVLAITNGQIDGNQHPYVGVLAAEFPGGRDWFCSGTLIAPKVFLTAAHCVDWLVPQGIDTVYVSFDPEFDPASAPIYSGHYIMAPIDKNGVAHAYDLAVVLLNTAVQGIEPATLPAPGYFDQFQPSELHDMLFKAVGYGASGRTNGGGPPHFNYDGIRRNAISSYNAMDKNWLHLSMNPATGDGGTCYGDSGGPNFIGAGADETKIIAGLTVTGDMVCRATNVIIRLDTAAAHQFIDPFLANP
jgi:hypothetical protein